MTTYINCVIKVSASDMQIVYGVTNIKSDLCLNRIIFLYIHNVIHLDSFFFFLSELHELAPRQTEATESV